MALLRRNTVLLFVLLAILLLCSSATEAATPGPALANADVNVNLPFQDDLDTKEQDDVSAAPSPGASAPSADEALIIDPEVIVLGH
ncbi:hypothetical protein MLD38_033426 [Melastoma candidum]|uniref:Uncharacterized protein n=1 Tax=Melastoma candidum TaxID=119954 RepID=A0ACB9MB24_9MYRT|nr:hypothetical protein MLD38_033426 [Melastoma candidum]